MLVVLSILCICSVSYSASSSSVTFEDLKLKFATDLVLITGENAHYTDILGCTKIAYAIDEINSVNSITMAAEPLNSGNIICAGGPAINPYTKYYDEYFGITYEYTPGNQFTIKSEGHSVSLNTGTCEHEGICIVYLGEHNNQYILLVWGYSWRCTYAGTLFISDAETWQKYHDAHVLLLTWRDTNRDGHVQKSEVSVKEAY